MTHTITDTQLHKLLDEVRRADQDHQDAEARFKAAEEAKRRTVEYKATAHNDARRALEAIDGPVIYDGEVWNFDAMRVVHERIGRDISPRQETLLPQAAA